MSFSQLYCVASLSLWFVKVRLKEGKLRGADGGILLQDTPIIFQPCFFSFSNVPQCPPPSTPVPHQAHPVNHPQAWPASGSRSKFKLKQGQLLLQPLWAPVIFPNPWGLFLSAARSQKGPVAQCEGDRVGGGEEEKEGREGGGGARAGSEGPEPRGGLHDGALSVPWFGIKQRVETLQEDLNLSEVEVSRWRPTQRRPSRSS